MYCVGEQPLVSVLFVAVLITLFLLKPLSLLVHTVFPRLSLWLMFATSFSVFLGQVLSLVVLSVSSYSVYMVSLFHQ